MFTFDVVATMLRDREDYRKLMGFARKKGNREEFSMWEYLFHENERKIEKAEKEGEF